MTDRKVDIVTGIECWGSQGRHPSGLDTDERLKPCPFCGHVAAIRAADHGHGMSRGHDKFQLSAECTNSSCAVRTPEHYATREAAIEAWNRRSEQA